MNRLKFLSGIFSRNYVHKTSLILAGSAGIAAVSTASSYSPPMDNLNISNNAFNMNNNEMNMQQKLSAESRAAEYVTKQCIIQGIPGCTVAVIKNNKLIWSYCYGYSDVSNNVLLTPYSIMRIASITKPITATGIAILMQQGKLSIDETVYDLLERLDNPRGIKIRNVLKTKYPIFYNEYCRQFTILNLCNHTSGIRHYNNSDEYLSTKHYNSLLGILSNFANEDLLFTPGQKYYYSSYGYIMLGLIIEAVTNMKYSEFMIDEIIKPLQMNHTFLELDYQKIIPNQSKQYIRKSVGLEISDYNLSENDNDIQYEIAMGGETRPKYKDTKIRKLQNAPYSDSTIKLSSGGFLSCAIDVALFGQKVVLGNFLSNRIKKLVFETNLIIKPKNENNLKHDNEIDNDDIEDFGYKDIEYGLGWHVYRKAIDPLTYNVEEICHGGGANGGCAHLLVLPQQELVVAVLINLQQAKPTISRDIAKFFINDYCE